MPAAIEMVTFNLTPLMQELGINQHMLAKLLKVSKVSISKWNKAGQIPVKHLAAINAITATNAMKVKKWIPCDLRNLRIRLKMRLPVMALRLQTCKTNFVKWQKRGEIPRDRLPLLIKLKLELPIESNSKEKEKRKEPRNGAIESTVRLRRIHGRTRPFPLE